MSFTFTDNFYTIHVFSYVNCRSWSLIITGDLGEFFLLFFF